VPISAWLADVLREHRARSGGVGLVFPSTAGTPLNKANLRKRVWIPLLKRAKVPYRDLYSLRWTFVSLARASREVPFNVSRVIGHARSTIVDTIYAQQSIRGWPVSAKVSRSGPASIHRRCPSRLSPLLRAARPSCVSSKAGGPSAEKISETLESR
jgi:hypothetical protein